MKKSAVLIILAITALLVGILIWLVTSHDYQSARVATLSTPKPGKPIPTVVWAYGDAVSAERYKNTIQDLQKAYANPISLRMFPSRNQMIPSLEQAALAGSLPDVFLGELPDLQALYQSHQLSLIPLKDTPNSEWQPDIFQAFIRGDSLLAYPSEYGVLVLYYNRRQFDRVGLAYADSFWTWDNLIEIARALYREPSNPKGVVYGLEYDPNLEFWNALACECGRGLYEGSRWNWGSPEAAGAVHDSLSLILDLQKNYAFTAPITHETIPSEFVEGHCAMAIAGPALRSVLRKDPNFEWGCTVLPSKTTVATPLFARGWAISAQTKSVDTAQGLARALSALTADDWISARATGTPTGTGDENYASVFQISLRYAQPPYSGPQAAALKQAVDQALNRLQQPTEIEADSFIAQLSATITALQAK